MSERTRNHLLSGVVFALVALLGACGTNGTKSTVDAAAPTTLPESPVTITLLHYNDLHAHLMPHPDLIATAPLAGATAVVERGGVARLATMIKRIRAEQPNSVLMNIGDTYHGGVEALFTLGDAIVDPVNALGIDICVPGNWDFAYGPLVTRLRYASLSAPERMLLSRASGVIMNESMIKRPNFPSLAANITYDSPFFKAGKPFLPPTWETERAGVKLGFIGISSDIVSRMSPTLARGLRFVEGEENHLELIERHARELRHRGAQLVFVMSELGIHKDFQLANDVALGSVDVFFSAHTHEATFTPLKSNSGALVVEAGNDGYLGRMDVTIGRTAKPTFHWQLLPIDRTVPDDPQMKVLVDAARAPFLVAHPNIKLPMPYIDLTLTQPIDHIVGYSKGPLDRRQALDNTFNRAFGEQLRQRAQADVAITPGFRFDAVIADPRSAVEDNTVADGAITIEDVYRFFPAAYALGVGEASGERLREIIEQNLTSVYSSDAFAQSGGWVDGFAGLRVELDSFGADGKRIQHIRTASGQALNMQATYRVAGCTRPDDAADVLCSYRGFEHVTPLLNPATRAPWSVAELFVDTLAQPWPVAPKSAMSDVSGAPQWPQDPFVQRLPR